MSICFRHEIREILSIIGQKHCFIGSYDPCYKLKKQSRFIGHKFDIQETIICFIIVVIISTPQEVYIQRNNTK